MSNFINLLDIIYPVGSMYFSVTDISPASSVGGTWEQIKDTVLAASGESYAGPADKYDGKKYILCQQMPFHTHELNIADVNAVNFTFSTNAISASGYKWSNHLAGNSSAVAFYRDMFADMTNKNQMSNNSNYRPSDNFIKNSDFQLMTSTCRPTGGGRTTFHIIIQSMYGKGLPNLFEGAVYNG